MARSKPSRREAGPRNQLLGLEVAALHLSEELPLSARTELEKYVTAWTRDLTVASSALQRDIRDGNQKRVSKSTAQLKRLAEALHRAPDRMEKHLVERSARLASDRMALELRLSEHEEAERKLQVASAELSRLVAEHARSEEERREAERALREVNARFEAAFGNAPIGMALVDSEGRWLEVNDALCRITGYSRDELKAKTLEAITDPDDVDLDTQKMRDLLSGHIQSYKVEKRYRHARGHHLWVLVFALDDCGSGFGSFYYLKALPFDYLKIDGDFIRGIVASPMDQIVVKAIVGIARGLGKKAIAEFVADEDTARLLRQSGVDYAQGYHVGQPRPLLEVLPTV